MKFLEKYDKTKPNSIESYAKKLVGMTFKDVVNNVYGSRTSQPSHNFGDMRRKGGLGNLIEELYFGIKPNSNQEADFKEAEVELKVTPYIKRKKKLVAKERLVLTMISYEKCIENDFYESHVWSKCKSMLLIFYYHNQELEKLYYKIEYVKLFSPPEEELTIIINDYKKIVSKIEKGKAHELHEGDTMYLGACTKGATAKKSTVNQFYPPYELARKRAYCFKQSYMTIILNKHIIENGERYERIVDNYEDLKNRSLEEYICNKINKYRGKSDKELCKLLGRECNNNKAQWIDLAYRMLGIKSNKAEELDKANIVVKAVRIEGKGHIIESSSLPTIKFKELIEEEWEESELYSYFDETKFLFIVYKKFDDEYCLMGSQIWNMPHEDILKAEEGWEEIKRIVREGVVFKRSSYGNRTRINNNLPKKNFNHVIHIRPHAQKSYYVFEDGMSHGPGKISDSDELPDGRRMTKQSFWLNNTYILSQLKNKLK